MVEVYITGLSSVYEIEHLVRLFYPQSEVSKTRIKDKNTDYVRTAYGKKSMFCGVRINGKNYIAKQLITDTEEKADFALSSMLYQLLCKVTGKNLPWGMLTGVRPVRLWHDMQKNGKDDVYINNRFTNTFFVSDNKKQLVKRIVENQTPVLQTNTPLSYSLYVSIPFCPSRCSYCSFVSRTTAQSAKIIQPYMEKLCLELAEISNCAKRNNLKLETVYIGGGTPTSINAQQLTMLLQCVEDNFDLSNVKEYTVEAGRPDCTDFEKLQILKKFGVTRVSINPQTFEDEVLEAIGRKHSAQDIIRCFEEARLAGHDNINMDLIAGLPKDTQEGFERTLKQVLSLSPENVTVHTLTLKRASNLVIDGAKEEYANVSQMLDACKVLDENGYEPYYLYRQKKTLDNLENTGYTKKGFTGLYNIYIMEEVHTILAAGAGASTKLVNTQNGRIERIFNYKYPLEYINQFETILQRKQGVDLFYESYLDT